MEGVFVEAEAIIRRELVRRGLGEEALRMGLRTRMITDARAAVVKRLRSETDLSWREIAHLVGSGGRRSSKKLE